MIERELRDMDVTVTWWHSRTGPDAGYVPWPEDEGFALDQGQAAWVRVAAANNGGLVHGAAYNLVAPMGATILRWDPETRGYLPPLTGAENEIVGVAPDHRVQFFYGEREWLPASYVWSGIYLVIATATDDIGLLYEIGDYASVRRIQVAPPQTSPFSR